MTMLMRLLLVLSVAAMGTASNAADKDLLPTIPDPNIPNLIGTWDGNADTIGDIYGLRSRRRTIHITEQTDRRFRGYFVYDEGKISFFGVIYPDNKTFTWVNPKSKGYNHGTILAPDRIGACYVEAGEQATAGCSDLKRISLTPPK
jgi:hypothetical protein